MRALAVVLLLGLLRACGTTPVVQEPPGNYVRVHDNPGGSLTKFRGWKQRLMFVDQVVISGYCASACVMLLELDNACYLPNTVLKLHGVSKGMFQRLSPRLEDMYDREYMREIPKSLHYKFWTEWRHHRGPFDLVEIEAKDVEDIRPCSKEYY